MIIGTIRCSGIVSATTGDLRPFRIFRRSLRHGFGMGIAFWDENCSQQLVTAGAQLHASGSYLKSPSLASAPLLVTPETNKPMKIHRRSFLQSFSAFHFYCKTHQLPTRVRVHMISIHFGRDQVAPSAIIQAEFVMAQYVKEFVTAFFI